MKVKSITTRALKLALDKPVGSALGALETFGCILIELRCDDGSTGENLVFTLHDRRTRVLRQMIDELAELAVGRDVGHIADFWARAWKNINFFGFSGISVMAISAIDGALWDATARAKKMPLYRMLGGARTSVPAYHSGGLWLSHSDAELIEEAQSFVAAGFRAIKMRLGSSDAREDARRVGVVRKAVGPAIALMADANQGLTAPEAIRFGRMIEEHQLAWFEEPLPAWDLDGCAAVAAALDTPIASGETEYTRYGFRRMIELKSADVLMPDLQRVGGVSEFMRVAAMAQAYDLPVSSHLFPETSIQVLGALSNASYLEYMPWFSKLYNEALEFKDGAALVPERPGFGFTFNQDYVAHLER